jgi:crotonobetainyl-CoA:carnitine CoA-transferase CaiB-like acyl-CoA transferase
MSAAPLAGVRVIDLGQVYAGPYCTSQLAFLGADVIKIEPPHAGEYLRMPRPGQVSYAFLMLNANKRSVTLDLKNERAREIFMRLLETADVLVENFVEGAMEKLGLGYEQIAARFPRLVYASGRGYGSNSDWSRMGATDYTVQAACGMVSATGYADRPGVRTPATFIDMGMGIHLAAGILAALFSRRQTGRGQRVEVAMHDVCIPAMTRSLAMVFEGSSCDRIANRHHGIAPSNHYPTEDGEISIFCLTQAHWLALARLMGREELRDDPRFGSPAERSLVVDEVDSIVASWSAGHKRDELVALLTERGIPCAPVRAVEEVAFDPEVAKRRMLIDSDAPASGPVKVLGTPIRLSTIDPDLQPRPPPALGEDTEEVLGSIGISASEIRRLRDAGAI